MGKSSKWENFINEEAVKSLYSIGKLNDLDIKDEKALRKAMGKIVKKIMKGEVELDIITDYKDSLLTKASKFFQNKEYDYARIFYATFFEHSINVIISGIAERNNWSKELKKWVFRRIQLRDKYKLLLELLKLPKFNDAHLRTISKLSDDRNAFIHYKWKPNLRDMSLEEEKKADQDLFEEFENIRKAVTYTKKYEAKTLYHGKKSRIRRLVRKSE